MMERTNKRKRRHYTYSFNGWSPAVTYVEEDVTYIAHLKTPVEYTLLGKSGMEQL